MRLKELIAGIDAAIEGDERTEIGGIVIDAAKAKPGDCFVCLRGRNADGHDFADLAVAAGAAAVICAADSAYRNPAVTVVRTADTRAALSEAACNFFGRPGDYLKIVTVVGTNGKSTTAYLTQKLLEAEGYKCGLIGTMYYEYDGFRYPSDMTTPDPVELQKMLAEMVAKGVEYVVMELSAHAIALKKFWGVVSEMTVFTNLSQDHLDFFGTMAAYKDCKKSYFDKKFTKLAIINSDDECGREILGDCNVPAISYGMENPADVFAIDCRYTKKGTDYVVNMMDEIFAVDTPLHGKFNIYNALAASVCAYSAGVSCAGIARALAAVVPPPGRFNVLFDGGVTYVVDFAHTPDGLLNLIREGRKLVKGRVLTVFGCGGDRDVKKRPLMGKIAGELSDIVIVTSDNPRTESRQAIAEDILAGMKLNGALFVELDRAAAINLAGELARPGDVVLIAGKGSENFIEENHEKIPYSDMAQVLRVTGRTNVVPR